MKRSASLPVVQKKILGCLAALQFATSNQLARLSESQPSHVSTALKSLLNSGLIDGSLHTRPMVVHLTPAGARVLGVPLPAGRRRASWSVMAHACHRNEAARALSEQHPGFRFLSHVELWKQGFNPGHGEHAAVDAAGCAWFVLLDDYMMSSDRISRAWTRRHTPNRKYWPDETGRMWRDVVQRFLIVCTDDDHAKRHADWISKERLPADLLVIGALWK